MPASRELLRSRAGHAESLRRDLFAVAKTSQLREPADDNRHLPADSGARIIAGRPYRLQVSVEMLITLHLARMPLQPF